MGGLPGEHLCEGAAAAPGGVCHHLLPARLPPSEREQVKEILSKGKVQMVKKESELHSFRKAGSVPKLVQLEEGLLKESFNLDGRAVCGCSWLHITHLGVFYLSGISGVSFRCVTFL